MSIKIPFKYWIKYLPLIIRFFNEMNFKYVLIGGAAFYLLSGRKIYTKDIDVASPNFPMNLDGLRILQNFFRKNNVEVITSRILFLRNSGIAQLIVSLKPPYTLGIKIFEKIYGRSLYHLFKDSIKIARNGVEANVINPTTYIVLLLAEPEGVRVEDVDRIESIIDIYGFNQIEVWKKIDDMNLKEIVLKNLLDLERRGILPNKLKVLKEMDCIKRNIVEVREIVLKYCLGEIDEKTFVEKMDNINFPGEKLLKLIYHTFMELDDEKWREILRVHPYAYQAFQKFWEIHGKPIIRERVKYVKSVEGIRDIDIVIWLAKELSST